MVGRPGGKRPLAKPRCRRDDAIKLVFKKGYGGAWTGFL
jgi:hypothetical protein